MAGFPVPGFSRRFWIPAFAGMTVNALDRGSQQPFVREVSPCSPLAGPAPAFPRIRRYRVRACTGQNRAREHGGIPMDLVGGKRMDRAIHIPPATDAALSARSELLKNKINIDKFTGFFNKKRNGEAIASCCNINKIITYLSVRRSNKAAKNFKPPHLPAFAVNGARLGAFPRKFSIPRIP